MKKKVQIQARHVWFKERQKQTDVTGYASSTKLPSRSKNTFCFLFQIWEAFTSFMIFRKYILGIFRARAKPLFRIIKWEEWREKRRGGKERGMWTKGLKYNGRKMK